MLNKEANYSSYREKRRLQAAQAGTVIKLLVWRHSEVAEWHLKIRCAAYRGLFEMHSRGNGALSSQIF